MTSADETTSIRWHGVTFELLQDVNKDWHLSWRKAGAKHHASGPDAAVMLAEAIHAAGFDEETKWKILDALMKALRERMFN